MVFELERNFKNGFGQMRRRIGSKQGEVVRFIQRNDVAAKGARPGRGGIGKLDQKLRGWIPLKAAPPGQLNDVGVGQQVALAVEQQPRGGALPTVAVSGRPNGNQLNHRVRRPRCALRGRLSAGGARREQKNKLGQQ
jgi:hypothetical protein